MRIVLPSRRRPRLLLAALGCLAIASAAAAQPSLPLPAAPFGGKIGETYADSIPSFPAPVTAPKGAPNILLVLTDDVGFGAAATFGGPVPTPNLDRLAQRGLIYNRFHTTAMCSPTRASLLTGRNHHAVHNGIVANLSTGFPGYDNLLPRSAATIAEVLRQNGYSTAMFGKHHNTPEPYVSPAGPFDTWPTGLGFDYFYGYMAAQTNQFTPALYRNTTPIPTLQDGVLDKALADEAIHWVHAQKAAAPDKPFFLYYAPGSTHNPLQAPADWIARFHGAFDKGWDAVRAETVARQKKAGLIPADTTVTPRPDGIRAWADLSPDQRRVNARLMEVYAAMLAYQDFQIGRLLDEIDRMGLASNTLVLFIEGDNGAAPEAGRDGQANPMGNFANGVGENIASLAANLDALGGPDAVAGYGWGWAWATNAPFAWFKQFASHLGGVRNGFVVSWPERITARGVRSQFAHVTDIVPTILEAVGLASPGAVNGVAQQRMDGVSLVYSFDAPAAPERHRTQYFEMMGNHALYHDGWWANTTPVNAPWSRPQGTVLPSDYHWELYDLRHDFAQARDLAAKDPGTLADLQGRFRAEGQQNQVFPLDDRLTLQRMQASEAQLPRTDHVVYWGGDLSLPSAAAPSLLNRAYRITAEVDIATAGATGVVLALGGKFAGWSFYLKDGRPSAVLAVSQFERDVFRVTADSALPAGPARLVFDFRYDGGINAGGDLILSANGREIGRGRIGRSISKLVELTDTLDVGFDGSTKVTGDYAGDGHFPGRITKIDLKLGKPTARGSAD